MLSQLVNQLSRELKMEEGVFAKERDCYVLSFEEDIEVEAVQSRECLLLKGTIAPPPEKSRDAFFLQIMEANLFGGGTRGAAIGWNESDNMLTLSRELDYNCSHKEFKEKLEDFVSVIDFWRKTALKHN